MSKILKIKDSHEPTSKSEERSICSEVFPDNQMNERYIIHKHPNNTEYGSQKNGFPSKKDSDIHALEDKLLMKTHKCRRGDEISTIINFFAANKLNLKPIIDDIEDNLMQFVYKNNLFEVHAFGSSIYGLALKTSDIDIHIANSFEDRLNFLSILFNNIRRNRKFKDCFIISNARVPIIKCIHKETDCNIDISCTNSEVLEKTKYISNILHFDRRIFELAFFIKIWAKQNGLFIQGQFNSYTFIKLMIYTLKQDIEFEYFKHKAVLLPDEGPNKNANYGAVLLPGEWPNKNANYGAVLLPDEGPNKNGNYGRHIKHYISIPDHLETYHLICHFFKILANYDYEKYIISPGKTETPKSSVSSMSQEDSFSMDNICNSGIKLVHMEKFRQYITAAHDVCQKFTWTPDAEFYEQLLFIKLTPPTLPANTQVPVVPPKKVNYIFSISIAERKTFRNNLPQTLTELEILNEWALHYICLIECLLTKAYYMNPKKVICHVSHKEMEADSAYYITYEILADYDTWTGRSNTHFSYGTFLQRQHSQGVEMLKEKERKLDNPMPGLFTIYVPKNYDHVEIIISHIDENIYLTKASPLHKFFRMLKSTLQNYNLKKEDLKKKVCI